MKFTLKIIISVVAIISIIFSISGIIMIKSNFKHSLEKTISQNIEAHTLERYGMENNIDTNINKKGEISKEQLSIYARSLVYYLENNKRISIYINDEKLYSNIEIDEDTFKNLNNGKEIKYILKDIKNYKYMLVSSSIEINNYKILLISRYDITYVFTESDRILNYFYKIDIAVILVSAISICILSLFLTKPIIKLNETSKKITQGLYKERIDIKSKDEIGELAKSFNIMIDNIEDKINELELSVKQREEFITNFTHELKNPMTSIIGYADILKSGKYDNDVNLRAANYIFNEAKRLETLAHKLMDLMELSNEHITLESLDIVWFMNNLYKDINDTLGEIKLELNIEKAYVVADKVLLESCLRNLIDNSKKANPKDKIIRVVGKVENNKYKISIIDKGCGIPEEDLPRITESFYMVDKVRAKTNGRSGIGLSICEKIAKLHNSKLEITSKVDEGTSISLYLEVENEK